MGVWLRKDDKSFFIVSTGAVVMNDRVTFVVPEKDFAAPEEVRGRLVRVLVEVV